MSLHASETGAAHCSFGNLRGPTLWTSLPGLYLLGSHNVADGSHAEKYLAIADQEYVSDGQARVVRNITVIAICAAGVILVSEISGVRAIISERQN